MAAQPYSDVEDEPRLEELTAREAFAALLRVDQILAQSGVRPRQAGRDQTRVYHGRRRRVLRLGLEPVEQRREAYEHGHDRAASCDDRRDLQASVVFVLR